MGVVISEKNLEKIPYTKPSVHRVVFDQHLFNKEKYIYSSGLLKTIDVNTRSYINCYTYQ